MAETPTDDDTIRRAARRRDRIRFALDIGLLFSALVGAFTLVISALNRDDSNSATGIAVGGGLVLGCAFAGLLAARSRI